MLLSKNRNNNVYKSLNLSQQIKNIIDDFDRHLTSIVIAIIISSKTLFRTLYDQRFRSYRRLKDFKRINNNEFKFSVFIRSPKH